MSGDPEHKYFADGMVEDIITALSQFTLLFVIALNSSFANVAFHFSLPGFSSRAAAGAAATAATSIPELRAHDRLLLHQRDLSCLEGNFFCTLSASRRFSTRLRALPTFWMAFFTATADIPVFFDFVNHFCAR